MNFSPSVCLRNVTVFLLIASAAPTSADILFEKYEKLKNEAWVKLYLGGVGSGYSWANAILRTKGEAPLYCEPTKLALQPDNYLQILNTFLSKNPREPLQGTPIDLILGYALQDAFPCNSNSQ